MPNIDTIYGGESMSRYAANIIQQQVLLIEGARIEILRGPEMYEDLKDFESRGGCEEMACTECPWRRTVTCSKVKPSLRRFRYTRMPDVYGKTISRRYRVSAQSAFILNTMVDSASDGVRYALWRHQFRGSGTLHVGPRKRDQLFLISLKSSEMVQLRRFSKGYASMAEFLDMAIRGNVLGTPH